MQEALDKDVASKAKLVLFSVQIVVLLICIITSIINISMNNGNKILWTMLLSIAVGIMLPNPKTKALKGLVTFS